MTSVGKKRGPSDLRHKQLTQLQCSNSGNVSSSFHSPVLRGASSLPSLPDVKSTKNATFTDLHLDVTLARQSSRLSPLKISRRASSDQRFVSSPGCERPVSKEAQVMETPLSFTTSSNKNLPTTRPLTRIQAKRGDSTNMAQAQDAPTNNDTTFMYRRHDATRKQQAQRLEFTRRRAVVAAASQSFFDQVAGLPIREAIQLFEAQRQALSDFCLQQFRDQVDDSELKLIHSDLMKMTAKVETDLQNRLEKLQQEELHTAQRKISLQQLKKSHQEQIQSHIATAVKHRTQDLAAREDVDNEQKRLDKSYEDREIQRKHRVEAYNEKLVEQIKNNAAERSTFKLAVQGSSPVCASILLVRCTERRGGRTSLRSDSKDFNVPLQSKHRHIHQ
ncbi:hypothetical protein P3T76_012604 [Phytophthora citrophthora]|uniref:Uncharacterized protein n=1 Tax=Phytophthora citrophthora TaxID=4793 RepID=A0AAD9G4V1_9STRA|nr:hypothetical protein P3T76_012604 [Phytophthora citrophthora]